MTVLEKKIDDLNYKLDTFLLDKSFFRIKEVARYIGLSVPTIYRLIYDRKIPHIRKEGSYIFYKEDIKNWLLKDRRETTLEVESRLRKKKI